MKVVDVYPNYLAQKVRLMTKTDDLIEALEKLSSMGEHELVVLGVSGIPQGSIFLVYPITDKVVNTRIIHVDENLKLFIAELRRGNTDDAVCLAINTEGKELGQITIRPCTVLEITEHYLKKKKPSITIEMAGGVQ